jgi:hypothetical protein
VHKEEFSIACHLCAEYTLDEGPSTFVRDKPIFSSEKTLYTDYYRKSSVGKISLVVSFKGLGAKTN